MTRPSDRRGIFLVFEGGDGAGKSTQVALLRQWLTRRGHRVRVTHEPGDTALGQRVRRMVLDPTAGEIDPRAEALLIAADKAQHLREVVRPALAAGAVVVSDRYVDSMIAYQGAGRQLGVRETTEIADWATGGLLPDLTIVLDVAPEQAVHRKAAPDRVEGAEGDFHCRVRQQFLRCAEAAPARYLVLPARESIESIAQAVRERVSDLLA